MEPSIIPLYYLCSLAGVIMVAGGIWLIYKQKIYIDRESGQITEIETPIGVKFKTNIPALVIFMFGVIFLIYPIWQLKEMRKEIKIAGNVKSNIPVNVFAVLDEVTPSQFGDFSLWVPDYPKGYKVLYIADNKLAGYQNTDLQDKKGRELKMIDEEISVTEPNNFKPNVSPVPANFK
jgi:hypothetical protein